MGSLTTEISSSKTEKARLILVLRTSTRFKGERPVELEIWRKRDGNICLILMSSKETQCEFVKAQLPDCKVLARLRSRNRGWSDAKQSQTPSRQNVQNDQKTPVSDTPKKHLVIPGSRVYDNVCRVLKFNKSVGVSWLNVSCVLCEQC